MNWISDIKEEFKQLDISKKKLKQFAYLVGSILLVISAWYFFRHGNRDWSCITGGSSILLILTGILQADWLKGLYKIWMGIAFVLGWFVSRILISIIFYLALTPISFLGRLFKKKWMDVDFSTKSDSYWISRKDNKAVDYEKMY
ncbi:MAG: hypothetical protein JW956_12250 [Calditrichaceae bacterium]|nr:hypothetical protein [Calditrichaceae bacterium]